MDAIHVQTALEPKEYEALRRIARRQRRSLKEVARVAIQRYLQESEDPALDPLLGLVGAGELGQGPWSERKDWREPRS